METGYFARAREGGHDARWTKVHVRDSNGRCLCGYKPHKTMRFFFNAGFIKLDYVECPECLKRAKKMLVKKEDFKMKNMGDALGEAIQKASVKKKYDGPNGKDMGTFSSAKHCPKCGLMSARLKECGTKWCLAENGKVFNEMTLRQEINKTWGEHGAHADVYNNLFRNFHNKDMLIRWLLGDDTGMSSEAIVRKYCGIPSKYGYSTPADTADFGRCYRLLKACPFINIEIMKDCGNPMWVMLIKYWGTLTQVYEWSGVEKNSGNWRTVSEIIDMISKLAYKKE